jgi:RHS repeat-associated protein
VSSLRSRKVLFPLILGAVLCGLGLIARILLAQSSPSICELDISDQMQVKRNNPTLNTKTHRFQQTVTIKNVNKTTITGPVALVLDGLSAEVSLYNKTGQTLCAEPLGSPYVVLAVGNDGRLSPDEQSSIKLEFLSPSKTAIIYTTRVVRLVPAPIPAELNPNPLTMNLGTTGVLKATLSSAPTSSGNLVVSSSNTNVATVPVSVSFSIGQNTVLIPVAAVGVGHAIITVSLNGNTTTGGIQVDPAMPTITSLLPSSLMITKGGSGSLAVTINAAQSKDVNLVLMSTDPGIAFVPSAATITAGHMSTLIRVNGNTPGTAQIVAELNGLRLSSTVTVIPDLPTVVSLTPSVNFLNKGATTTIKITLSAAQPNITNVALAAIPNGIVTIPETVTVPAGDLTTNVLMAGVGLGTAALQASLNGMTIEAAAHVTATPPQLKALLPPLLPVVEGVTSQLTVALNATQSTNTIVNLSVDTSAILQIPPTVTIPAGQVHAAFTIRAIVVGEAVITASLLESSKRAAILVRPPPSALFSVLPNSVSVEQGATTILTFLLNAAPPTNTNFALSASPSGTILLPEFATIDAGQLTTTVPVTGLTLGSATISATLDGRTLNATVMVRPPPTVILAQFPSTLTLLKGIPGMLYLTVSPAPKAPTVFAVTSSAPLVASAPSTVTIPAGALFAEFPIISHREGSANITARGSGSAGGTATTQILVTPPELVTLAISPEGPSIFVKQTQSFTATGIFTDGAMRDVASQVTWSSSAPAVASINANGLATSYMTGNTTIIAAASVGTRTIRTSTILTILTAPVLEITSAAPNAAPYGTMVTIQGRGFLPTQGSLGVTVVGVTVTPSAVTDTTLTFLVPESAPTGPTQIVITNGTSTAQTPFTVTNPAPALASLSPREVPAGSSDLQLGLQGDRFVPGSMVQFGQISLPATYISRTGLSVVIPASALRIKGRVAVAVINPTPGGGTSTDVTFTILDRAPVISPIGNRTAPLGTTLSFTVTALDPDGDPVTFAASPLPLPAHATFDAHTGVFTFAPTPADVGALSLSFVATDGELNSANTVTITVPSPPTNGTTAVAGRVTDVSGHPLANVTVVLKSTSQSTMTNAEGLFSLMSVPAGRQQLLVDGRTAGDYAILVTPVDLIANVTTQLPSNLALPLIDNANAVAINPAATTIVSNPNVPGVSVTIAPGAAKNPDGTFYAGRLSISPVPEYGRPESRPVELRPGLSITIQPAGVPLDPPAPITFANVDGMTPGSELDLWSLFPDTGTFLQVGTARVSPDGQSITTISGGVRKTAWHFVLAAPAVPATLAGIRNGDCAPCDVGSQADLEEGALALDQFIPGIRSLGVSRGLSLRYRSTLADVRPILPVEATLNFRTAVPRTFSARLTVGGIQQGGELYWNASGLPVATTSVSRLAMQMDASSLLTGRYPYELMLFSNYSQSSIGGATPGKLLVRNERTSPFGAGWTLAGLDRLLAQSDSSLVLAKGDGSTAVFAPLNRPLVVESFGLNRSVVINGVNNSFVSGALFAEARADLLNPANFGPTGTISRPITLRSGVDTVTPDALSGVDVFILNPIATELTPTEAVVLEQFVQDGGMLLEARNVFPNRPVLLGSTPGPFANENTAVLTVAGLNSMLTQGPFGSVNSPIVTGANGAYATTGFGVPIAANGAGPNILQFQPDGRFSGTGRAVLIGDEEIFASGFASGGANFYAANRTFFLNIIAFAADAPGFRSSPPPAGQSRIYVGPPGDFSSIVKNTDGTFTRTLKEGTKTIFNTQGLQVAVTDRNSNTTTYVCNRQDNLTTITDPAGQTTTLTYTGGLLSTVTDPAGRVTQFSHDGQGNLTGITYADGSQAAFAYDPQHRLTQRTDARNQTTQYAYDYAGRLMQATPPTGDARMLSPSQRAGLPNVAAGEGIQGNPAMLAALSASAVFRDGNGHVTTFTLDALGRVIKQTDALNRTTIFIRDAHENPLTITRPNGAVSTMTYDAKGNLLTTTEQAIEATMTFTYDSVFNQVTSIKDPLNNTTTITYDTKGNPTQIKDAVNNVTSLSYDTRGLLTSTKDALNQTTTFTYDALGRLLTTTDPLNRTTNLTYDAAGNVATSTDALTRVIQFQYDPKNRLTQVTDPAGGVSRYAYDGNGNLLAVTDAKNQVTSFAYDPKSRLVSTTDPLGKTETYAYDGADNLTARVTPKGDTIAFVHDAVNQLLSKTLPGNQVSSYSYDSMGNLIGVTDPDSKLAMTYDLANRKTSVSTAGPSNQPAVTLSYAYDKTGKRVTLSDPMGHNTYAYDAVNRLTALSSPSAASGSPASAATLVAWWPASGTAADQANGHTGTLLNGVTFAPGPVGQAFSFDGVDDVVSVANTADLNPSTAMTVTAWITLTDIPQNFPVPVTKGPTNAQYLFFVSALAGSASGTAPVCFRINTGPSNPTSSTQLVLHDVCSTTKLVYGQALHMAGEYDGSTLKIFINGVLENTVAATGTIASDPRPLLIGAGNSELFGSGPSNQLHGLVDEVQLYNRALSAGEVAASLTQGVTSYAYDALSRRTSVTLPNGTQTTYTYDPARQVTSILHQIASTNNTINNIAYSYDAVGNRTQLSDRRGTQMYGYDSLNRLASATHPLLFDQNFSYDSVGNRANNASLYNAGNQLIEDFSFRYKYDSNGNLSKKTFKATQNHIDYTYDAENRLTKVEEFAAGAVTPFAIATYRYDGLGRRIEKTGNGFTRRYIYDDEDILLEYDENNTFQARYTHGPGIDEPISMQRGGANYFYHQDALGTVSDLSDSSGVLARSYAYDAWGNIIQETGQLENPYAYTGREFDVETGLYYYRARYYDPRTGRFLQHDPIGMQGGMNLYAYALGNPIKLTDPLGLASFLGSCGSTLIQRVIILDLYFEQPCDNHDKCYSRCGPTKTDCDGQFYIDMVNECSKLKGLLAQDCSIEAVGYYSAVDRYGAAAYKNAQAHCKSCK